MTYPAALAVESTFAALGEPAVVDPSCAAVPVTVVRYAASDSAEFADIRVTAPALTFEIRAAEAGLLASGVEIAIAGEVLVVQGAPEFTDPLRLVKRFATRRRNG